jgi:hypothetical protein
MRNIVHSKQKVFLLNVNRYNVLSTLIEPQIKHLPIPYKMLTTPKKNSGKNGVKSSAKHINRWKIIIIGDSQARGSPADIKHVL